MQEKRKNTRKVPNLRFGTYRNDWIKRSLGDAASKINSGKTPLGGEATYKSEGVLFIRSQNINGDKLELGNSAFISQEINNGMRNSVVQPNDILLNITGASLGRSCVVPKDFTIGNVNQHVCIIRLNKDYNPRFVQPILSSHKGQNIFLSIQTGSGREGLNFENIKKIQFLFPSIEEQNKIASFLSVIDERIQTQNKIIKALETLIKGLREQIFTKRLRFKDYNGNDFPDWEEKRLGELLDYEQPTNYLVKSTEYSNSYKTPVLTAGKTFVLGYTNETEGIFENNLPVIIFDDFTTATQFVDFPFKTKSSAMKILKAQSGNNIKYIYEVMQTIKYELGGHERHWISKFTQLIVSTPCIAEQTRIANFLSAINEKIETEKKILKQCEKHKKYLLKNLFI